jgi:hypothetical protein
MTQEAIVESQAEPTQQVEQPGTSDQVVGPVVEDVLSETESSPLSTHTQAEWDEREYAIAAQRATSDRQVAQARQAIAQRDMERQITESERGHQDRDRRAVDDGEITESQLSQRRQEREIGWTQQIAFQKQVAQDKAEHYKLVTENEAQARIQVAGLLAKDHGVDTATLLNDKSLISAGQMANRARELALDKRDADLKGKETFDAGQLGAKGISLADMTPEEKIGWGVSHPPKRSR